MTAAPRGLVLLLAAALLAGPVRASDEDEVRVEVHVTAVTGSDLYLDAGREQGLEPGDRVRLWPAGASQVQARIVSVSRSTARGAGRRWGAGDSRRDAG